MKCNATVLTQKATASSWTNIGAVAAVALFNECFQFLTSESLPTVDLELLAHSCIKLPTIRLPTRFSAPQLSDPPGDDSVGDDSLSIEELCDMLDTPDTEARRKKLS